MDLIEQKFTSTEENLAFDALLLSEAETGQRPVSLRFWEAREYTVVLGRGSIASDDIFIDRCKKDGIKVLQRISGGGTVLLGKGCVNYSAIIPYIHNPALKTIKKSFQFILEKIIFNFKKAGINLNLEPVSDLSLDNKKVSGNAQARKKMFLLHHGTFLYDFDIDRISFYLKNPKKYPVYRNSRAHKDFLTNLNLPRGQIINLLTESLASL